MKVWKATVPVQDQVVPVSLPVGATILSVQVQGGLPCIWFQCDPEAVHEWRAFQWVGTGHGEVGQGWVYIGTVQEAPFVFHLFEIPYEVAIGSPREANP